MVFPLSCIIVKICTWINKTHLIHMWNLFWFLTFGLRHITIINFIFSPYCYKLYINVFEVYTSLGLKVLKCILSLSYKVKPILCICSINELMLWVIVIWVFGYMLVIYVRNDLLISMFIHWSLMASYKWSTWMRGSVCCKSTRKYCLFLCISVFPYINRY